MPTPSSKPVACKKCGKPGFKDAAGVMQHEQRADPAVYGGRRAAPPESKPKVEEPTPEQPPKREHLLHREVFGRKPAA